MSGKKASDEIICKVAGHLEPILRIYPGRTICGHITDGISLANGEKAARYVVSFVDFEAAYLAAKAFRENNPITPEEQRMADLIRKHRGGR